MRASVWMARRLPIVAFMVMLLVGCRPSIGPAPTATSGPTAEPLAEASPTVAPATPTPEPPTPTVEPTQVAVVVECTVNARSLRLRSGPTTDAAIITGLPSGQPLTASGHNPESTWLAVQTPDGLSGWVSAEFVTCAQPIDSLPVATAAPAVP
jgi:uncharacterized protein YgiM (DUF1202 family)